MEVAKGISNKEYQKLNLADHTSRDWQKVADIFEKRFSGRYIEPADALIEAEALLPAKDKKFGFAVVAIDCLLIETLACFYKGYIETPRRQNAAVYTAFLTQPGTELSKYFDKDTAGIFYNEVRCGILHQSETKNQTLIRAIGPLVKPENGSIIINRIRLHEAVKKEFEDYIEKIRIGNDVKLRGYFKDKMDHICR